jgi:predicted phosphodiesterase
MDRRAALPRTFSTEVEGVKLLLLHFHLRPGKQTAPIHLDPFASPSLHEPDNTKFRSVFRGYEPYDAVFFGHVHLSTHFRTESSVFLNPGSLGCFHLPLARYALITLKHGSITWEMRYVPYDNRDFLLSYEKLGVPDRSFILRIFHGNQHLE